MAKQEYVEPKTLESLKDLLTEGDEVQLDLTEDAWEFGAPPPAGVYDLKLFLAKDGIKYGFENPKEEKGLWIQFNLECRIVNSQEGVYDDIPVFTRVNTRIYRGKNISTMAGLMVKLGFKIPDKLTPKKLAQYMDAALKKEPVIKAELDWRGAYSYKDKDGKDVWENVFNKYSQFPDDKEHPGMKLHICEVTGKEGRKVEVKAQVQVNTFYGKGEVPKEKGLVSQPKLVQKLVAKEPELPMMVQASKVNGASNVVSSEEDDLKLMLQD